MLAINEAIQDLAGPPAAAAGRADQLELDLETPGRLVRVDPTQLDQVLVNLAVNARDAMPGGRRLTLRTGHVTLYRPLNAGRRRSRPAATCMIEVEDTGGGIPPEVLPRIFDPFFTTQRESGGTGLGLSTVHGIVRQSDGFLAVESEIGQGHALPPLSAARMRRSRRRAARRSCRRIRPAAAAPARVARRTVLLVEDEDTVRRLAERALRQRGWEVLARRTRPKRRLALLDDRRRRMRASPAVRAGFRRGDAGHGRPRAGPCGARATASRLPAILVSGYAEETFRQDCTGPGIVFLSKPYTLKALLATVQDVAIRRLNRRRQGCARGSLAKPVGSAREHPWNRRADGRTAEHTGNQSSRRELASFGCRRIRFCETVA